MVVKSEKKINFHQFLLQFIKFNSSIESEQNICKMLSCLIYSKKGITINTLRRAAKVQLPNVEKFLNSFKPLIYKGEGTYIILGKTVKRNLIKIICEKISIPEENLEKQTHAAISRALKK